MFGHKAFATDVTPQTIRFGLLFDFATSQPIPAVTNLVHDWDRSDRLGCSRSGEGLDRLRTKGVDSSLWSISEMIRVKITVTAKQGLGAAVLVFLKVCDKMVHDCSELVQ